MTLGTNIPRVSARSDTVLCGMQTERIDGNSIANKTQNSIVNVRLCLARRCVTRPALYIVAVNYRLFTSKHPCFLVVSLVLMPVCILRLFDCFLSLSLCICMSFWCVATPDFSAISLCISVFLPPPPLETLFR